MLFLQFGAQTCKYNKGNAWSYQFGELVSRRWETINDLQQPWEPKPRFGRVHFHRRQQATHYVHSVFDILVILNVHVCMSGREIVKKRIEKLWRFVLD